MRLIISHDCGLGSIVRRPPVLSVDGCSRPSEWLHSRGQTDKIVRDPRWRYVGNNRSTNLLPNKNTLCFDAGPFRLSISPIIIASQTALVFSPESAFRINNTRDATQSAHLPRNNILPARSRSPSWHRSRGPRPPSRSIPNLRRPKSSPFEWHTTIRKPINCLCPAERGPTPQS